MDAGYLVTRIRGRLESLLPDPELAALAEHFTRATALEIGGPTALFAAGGRLAVYGQLAALDAANFSRQTLWDGSRFEGISPRRHFIAEAGSLEVASHAYDAVLASHVVEHLADPVGAVREWRRVLKPGGLLLLVVPHRDHTFDHRRPVTEVQHLLADADRRTPENDLTHLDEILRLHDLRRDPGAGSPAAFEHRCRENERWRALHHHVFVPSTVATLCELASLDVERLTTRRPFHIICLARPPNETGRDRE
jgi:SAM-dependent methyltransferase